MRRNLTAGFALLALFSMIKADAFTEIESGLHIACNLETPKIVMLGEPIIVDLTIRNTTNHDMMFRFGTERSMSDPTDYEDYDATWYDVDLVNANGQPVKKRVADEI